MGESTDWDAVRKTKISRPGGPAWLRPPSMADAVKPPGAVDTALLRAAANTASLYRNAAINAAADEIDRLTGLLRAVEDALIDMLALPYAAVRDNDQLSPAQYDNALAVGRAIVDRRDHD